MAGKKLPTIELIMWDASGEWKFALVLFDKHLRSTTAEGNLGSDHHEAMRRARVIVRRLGLTRAASKRHSFIWRKLVTEGEF